MKKKACRPHPQWSALVFAASAFVHVAPVRAQSVDWSSYNGTLSADHFSPLTEITRTNVASLREVCTFDTGEQIGFQVVPVVIAGTMFITTDTATYAFDAKTGRTLWDGSFGDPAKAEFAPALDGRTGKVLWRAPTNNAIGGGVITYAVGGHQYIAASAGIKSAIWPVKSESARVVVFALP
jgi:alcohol dehydrogenase (cytochrome c)